MRLALAAAAAVLSASVATALSVSPVEAQKRKQATNMSVNQCIELARQRGYTESDISGGGPGRNTAAKFVKRCLEGKQR
jgi:hypothetical protein